MSPMSALIAPHGGTLVDRIVADPGALTRRAATLPRVTLDARELGDLELIATGAASPLVGFATAADYEAILAYTRLASGVVWPFPLTLAIADSVPAEIGGELALYDAAGRLWGVLSITSVYARETEREIDAVYGTRDPDHPGVASTRARPTRLVGGPVDVLPLPANLPLARYRTSPRALRAAIEERGWRRVAGLASRELLLRTDEHRAKLALELADGLVLQPALGDGAPEPVPPALRFAATEAIVAPYFPPARVILAGLPGRAHRGGPKQALFDALVAKNHGIGQLVVEPAAHAIFGKFPKLDLGVAPLAIEPAFHCRACESIASARTCPHDGAKHATLSTPALLDLLARGGEAPAELVRPEVVEVLRAHVTRAPIEVTAVAPTGGFILWFTGLSGAGKSTLANAVATELRATHRIEILDGDEVRTHLSKGLGFSKEDRDTNVHRIGFVARTLAQHGVGVITAAISPYAETRAAVRALAEERGIAFVEVFAHSSLEALVARDVKGLYRQALAGEVAHFTGVTDPYEVPTAPDVRVETDRESVAQSTAKIIAVLRIRGLHAPLPLTAPGASPRLRAGA